jgi:hypothetical protein
VSKFKDMKFKVNNPEHSEQIQECLFRLGYLWAGDSSRRVQILDSTHLYAEADGIILHSNGDDLFFSNDENKETTLEELQAMFVEQDPIDNSIPEHNIENTMTQFLNQLQKRLESVNLSVYIYSDEIQVSDMDSDAIAKVTTYEELLEAIKVKEQFMNMFKEV